MPITEHTFHLIQLTLQKLFLDDSVPKEVRRRILEASVRTPGDWHRDAIMRAWSSGDRDWMLTAVFAMKYVRGFDDLTLNALKSSDRQIEYEAVEAAGNWQLEAAWPHIAALVRSPATPKFIRVAAIGAVASIRPQEAREILFHLTDSHDEEIAEAAEEAIALAITEADLAEFDDEFDDEDEEEEDADDWLN